MDDTLQRKSAYALARLFSVANINVEELAGVFSPSARGFSSRFKFEWEEGIVNFLS
jgi:hypothetical protein